MTQVEEGFQLLRAIAFITPAIALLLNLINPLRRERREESDKILFRWILASFTFLILAGIVDVTFLVLENFPPLFVVKGLIIGGMLILLYPTMYLLFRKIN